LLTLSLKSYFSFKQNLAFSQTPALTTEFDEKAWPVRIIIPRTETDLPVFPGRVNHDFWEVADEGASYLVGSGFPGQKGNVVVYGHNYNHLLGPIRWLAEGEEIKLLNQKGEESSYKVQATKVVSPETVAVLEPTEEAILTLYTCTGFLDRERYVVIAQLQSD